MNEGKCVHFNGVQNQCCKAGVDYEKVFGPSAGMFLRMPCHQFNVRPAHGRGTYIKPGEETVRTEIDRREQNVIPCEHLHLPTHEECEASRVEAEAHMEKFRTVMIEVKSWRTWTKTNRVSKQEIITCPACGGKLHLSQAAYNGHVWGQCETKDCVSWME